MSTLEQDVIDAISRRHAPSMRFHGGMAVAVSRCACGEKPAANVRDTDTWHAQHVAHAATRTGALA